MTLSPRTLRITAWTAVVTLTLMLVIWFTGPYIVSRVGQTQLTKLLGRTVTFGSVRIEPWDLALSIEDFRMARAVGDAAQGPQLQIRHLRVNMDARSIVRLAPIVEGVVIDDPSLRLARTGAGRYDVEDIVARLGAPPPADAPPAQPQRFALFNLKLRGGMVAIDDRPVNRKHELRDLLIDLPFLSNLPADVEVKVQPRLAFSIDGTRVDSGAETTPFAATQASVLDLKVGDVDLAEWAAYWPANLPVRPKAGHLSVDMQVKFELHKEKGPRLSLHGAVRSRDVSLTDTRDGALLDWRALEIRLGEVRPLDRVAALEGIRLEGPLLSLVRDAKGDLNVLTLTAPANPAGNAKVAAAAPASAPAAAPAAASAPPPPDGWRVSLKQIELTDGRLKWDDASTRPAAALALHSLAIRAQTVAWPMAGPVPWTVEATLADGDQDAGHFVVSGEATVDAIRAETQLDGFGLAALDPYLTTVLRRRLEGAVTARALWQMTQPFGEPQQSLAISSLQATDLRLAARGAAPRKVVVVGKPAARPAHAALWSGSPSLRKLEITDAKLQLDTRRLSIAKVALTEPSIELARDAKGELNLREWLVMPERDGQAVPAVEPAPVDAKPWAISVAEVALEAGRGRWRDAAAPASEANPAYLELEALKVNLKSVSWPATGTSRLAVSTRLRQVVAAEPSAGNTESARRQSQPGRIEWTGDVTPEPLAARGRLVAERVPVHALEPYLHAAVPFDLRRADAGFKGTVDVKSLAGGLQARLEGDARVTDMKVFARTSDADAAPDELLRWQALEVPGLKVLVQPGAKPAIEAGDSTLTDFYAKLLITEQGKLNLSDATGSEVSLDGKTAPAAPPAVGVALGPAAASTPAPEPAAAASAPAQPAKPSPVNMSLAGLKLVNGHVDFTDHFIRPNYSAALTQLNGRLGTFRSGSTEMAPLELTGIAAGTAQLDIRGSLNPTASPLALDIRAKASDLELAPLSPYAGKYAGYLIERGKLTMDLQYLIKPDGTLTASNQVVLNQLTFGDKVESPDATSLPVRLAVALLKDADGVIDINLPISGSLNDPQFSFGGLIWKVITNLLVKAVTAPFSLLTGGGEQSNAVEFAPGTAYLVPSSVETIERVGKALVARPNLQLTVAGAADPVSEREAIQQAAVDAMVQAELRKAQLRAGKPVSDVPTAAASAASAAGAAGVASAPMIASAPPALPTAERERIVREIYQDTKLPNKPRNLVGWPKDLPLPEMETLLRNAQVVSVDSARDLALRRGLAVRDALVAQGLPSERLFQAAPKVRASGEGDANWKPIVELSLAPR